MLSSSEQNRNGGNLGSIQGRRACFIAGSSSLDQDGYTATPNDNTEPQDPSTRYPDLSAIGTHTPDAVSQSMGDAPTHLTDVSLATLPNAVVARDNVNRSFQCELCRVEFTVRGSLSRHELTKHNSDICPKFNCPEPNCERHSRPFLRVDSLIRHQRELLHFENSAQLGTVYNQHHEPSGVSSDNQMRDLDQLMEPGQTVQLHQRSLPDQREYLHGIQREVQSRCNDIRSQLHQLGSELMLCTQTDHRVTECISEIDEIEALENRHNFPNNRIRFS